MKSGILNGIFLVATVWNLKHFVLDELKHGINMMVGGVWCNKLVTDVMTHLTLTNNYMPHYIELSSMTKVFPVFGGGLGLIIADTYIESTIYIAQHTYKPL